MTVWHLETDWAQPRGPHAKTRLVSRSSRRAAQHRYALTEADALAMNLHLCSWAPAAATEVCSEAFMSLWDEAAYDWHNPWLDQSVHIFDIRSVAALADGETRLAHALLVNDMGSECPTDPETVGAGGVVSSLPFTGVSALAPAVTGAGLILGGLVALRVARVNSPSRESADV
jgi:hypothetical protein